MWAAASYRRAGFLRSRTGGRAARARAQQGRLDHRDEWVRRNKRFLQDSVGAYSLRLLLVQRVEGPDQQNNRDVRQGGIAFDEFADLVTISDCPENVSQNQIAADIGDFADRGFAVADGNND